MPTAPSNSGPDRAPQGRAINVGANATLPGIRGRIWPDSTFEYLPIPERRPTAGAVVTYGDLDLPVPADLADREVHLDPSFAGYLGCRAFTYGDEHAVKAAPLGELRAGDFVWFYATLSPVDAPDDAWGAYLIGQFRLRIDPVDPETFVALAPRLRHRLRHNAHFRRREPDAEVLLLGDPADSALFRHAAPLSDPAAPTEANAIVTEWSQDSGRGPWWRRVLRFDADGVERLRDRLEGHHRGRDDRQG